MSATLSKGLHAEGFVVVAVGTGVDGLYEATENSFDVVVLDIMLPGHSGYEVLRRMRAREIWTPVLMLTAKDGEYDETDAFDLGADDYLTKPFSFGVLSPHLLARRHHRPHLADKALLEQALGAAMTGRCADADHFRQLGIAEPAVILQQTQHLEVDAIQSNAHERIFHYIGYNRMIG